MKHFFLLVVLFFNLIIAQEKRNASVPTPKQVLDYELGYRFSSHINIEKYIHTLRDAASDRVRISSYGETHEQRKLYLA
ncbi:MAG TPA: hypothetical protein VFF29_01495, partial [Bacteroidota bacterium]|nr:hypothetical protein [Bacteroidota bacterium]